MAGPINVSSTTQTQSGELLVGTGLPVGSVGLDVTGIAAVDTLVVGANTDLGASTYINFGSTVGSAGYSIWNKAGTLNFKNSGGSWQSLQQFVCSLTTCFGSVISGSGTANYVPRPRRKADPGLASVRD